MRIQAHQWVAQGVLVCGAIFMLCAPVRADVVYREDRPGRHVLIRMPSQSTTTVNKTVRIYAPPGSTVIYGEMPLYDDTQPSYIETSAPPLVSLALHTAQGQCLTVGQQRRTETVAVTYIAPCITDHPSQTVHFRQGRITVNGLCLQTQGSRVMAAACSGTQEQDWRWQQHRIVQPSSGQCVTGPLSSQVGELTAQPCGATDAQYFD